MQNNSNALNEYEVYRALGWEGMSAEGVLKEMNPRGMPVCRVETMATMSRSAQRGWLLLGSLSSEGGKGQGMLYNGQELRFSVQGVVLNL